MDDHTEVPQGQFRVKYKDHGVPGYQYTRSMSHPQAVQRSVLMGMSGDLSSVNVVPADDYQPQADSVPDAEFTGSHDLEAEVGGAFSHMPEDEDEAQAREDGRPPCDLCGKHTHSFEDCEAAEEIEEELMASATVSEGYASRQNRHAALDMAIRVVTSPHSPFRTERASADEIVSYAEKFAEFLNG